MRARSRLKDYWRLLRTAILYNDRFPIDAIANNYFVARDHMLRSSRDSFPWMLCCSVAVAACLRISLRHLISSCRHGNRCPH